MKSDKPYLKLAPIKVEIVHQHPLAVMFRGVITDGEIEQVQKMALKRV